MDRENRARRLRHLGPLFVMTCGALAIAIVVLGVLWISDQPFSDRLPPSLAEDAGGR
jgi:hypothetical protein